MWHATPRVPSGSGFGSPTAVAAEFVGADGFVVSWVVFAVFAALAWLVGSRLAGRDAAVAAKLREGSAALVWGAALPLLAVVLDAFAFWPTAPPLLALGFAAGALLTVSRLRGAHLGPSPMRARGLVTVAAIAIPMTLVVSGWSAPSGDEPNYLTVAHSIAFDGDLDLADEFAERVYAPFHPAVLSPHYRPGLRPGSRYSMHGVGLPLLLAPAYALGRLIDPDGGAVMVALSRALLVLLYGAFAWSLYGYLEEIVGARAARLGTAATTLLAPLLFAPTFLFAETPAMLLSLVAFRGLTRAQGAALRYGWALAVLPFFGVKYIPIALAIVALTPWASDAGRRLRRAASAAAPVAAALALHAAFTWRLYGSLSPASLYLGAGEPAGAPALGADWAAYLTAWPSALATAIGYLLDQKEGLLAYGPHFILALVGCAVLARRRPRHLAALALVAAAYVGPYALSQQLGGQGPPVRPLMAVLWVLAPGLGIALTLRAESRWYAALRGGLLGTSACLTVAYAMQPHLLPHDYPVVASRLLQQYTPHGSGWWRFFPQWVNVEDPAWMVTGVWTLVAAALGVALWRYGSRAAARAETDVAREEGAVVRSLGARVALAVIVVASALVIVHHAAVVRTDRHRPTDIGGGLTAWIGERLPPVAYAEAEGIWVTAGDAVDFVVTAAVPLDVVDVSLRTLVEADVAAVIQGAETRARAAPGDVHAARLRPGRPRSDDGRYAYHVRVQASRGAAPADVIGGGDERYLGAFLRVVAFGER